MSELNPEMDIVIWRPRLVATMIDLLEDAQVEDPCGDCWGIDSCHVEQMCQALFELLDRDHDGWIIAEVPVSIVDQSRRLRIEAYRRLREQ